MCFKVVHLIGQSEICMSFLYAGWALTEKGAIDF